MLQALADTTSVAMENMQLYQDLERRVEERTDELIRSNDELKNANKKLQIANEDLAFLNSEMEGFTSAISHDLRAPIRKITMFVEMAENRISEGLDEKSRDYIRRAKSSAARMGEMLEDLLSLSRAARTPAKRYRQSVRPGPTSGVGPSIRRSGQKRRVCNCRRDIGQL